jgi:GxxExxY protein
MPLDQDALNQTSSAIIEAAIKVHSILGPGLLESVYCTCLAYELRARGLAVETEKAVPVYYEGLRLDGGYRIDLLVEDSVIVEVKSTEKVLPVHYAQLLSYLKLLDKRLGLLINFNTALVTRGVKRVVNHF